MIVPVLPGISIKNLLAPKQPLESLPFPLKQQCLVNSDQCLENAKHNASITNHYPLTTNHYFYYFARNGIYHGLKHFNIKPGDEVLMPELNSTIEPQVVRALGAIPVFYKILTTSSIALYPPLSSSKDFTPDWSDVQSKLTSKTKFFHLIHYLGIPNDIDTALEFCEKHKLIFFEDAAYGFLSGHHGRVENKNQKDLPLSTNHYPLTTALGSFGHFSILCPRKTIPLPNGAVLVINHGTWNMPAPLRSARPGEHGTKKQKDRNVDPSSMMRDMCRTPLRVRYSSLWDWSWLLRNHPSNEMSKFQNVEMSKVSRITPTPPNAALPLLKSLRQFVAAHKGYVHHDLGEFDLDRLNWGMTKLAYHQLFKFDYPTIVQKNLENFTYVRDFCVNKGWDIFPREIRPGTVPNAILLRIPKDVILSLSKDYINETLRRAQSDNAADVISSLMLQHGIQLARPWHWNENLTTKKNLPSVDAYTGRGLILPIHYQLTREHLDYYLSLLAPVLR